MNMNEQMSTGNPLIEKFQDAMARPGYNRNRVPTLGQRIRRYVGMLALGGGLALGVVPDAVDLGVQFWHKVVDNQRNNGTDIIETPVATTRPTDVVVNP